MPGFNQSGPAGQGPMTGRKMGRCTNFGAKQTSNTTPIENTEDANTPAIGQGRGMGRGRGLGRRGSGMGRQNRFRGGDQQ